MGGWWRGRGTTWCIIDGRRVSMIGCFQKKVGRHAMCHATLLPFKQSIPTCWSQSATTIRPCQCRPGLNTGPSNGCSGGQYYQTTKPMMWAILTQRRWSDDHRGDMRSMPDTHINSKQIRQFGHDNIEYLSTQHCNLIRAQSGLTSTAIEAPYHQPRELHPSQR